jgi:predicted nucleic acid-binding protein
LKGWLLDTNVVAALINPNGAPRVKQWAAVQPEDLMFLSVLTLGEYDKGVHNLALEHPERSRYMAARDALESRFAGRILPVDNAIVRSWGAISGKTKRQTGHSPSVINTLLAATAIEHDLFLATRNTKDVRHSGAAVFNPWEDDSEQFPLI